MKRASLVFAVLCSLLSSRPTGRAHGAFDGLYVANEGDGTVHQFSSSGTDLGIFKSGFNEPAYISSNATGDLLVSNFGGNTVQEYSPQGTLLLTITTPFQPGDTLTTPSGDILVGNYYGGSVYEYSSSGQGLGLFANPGLARANFMALDSQGNLYVTDYFSGVVSKISSSGVVEGNIISNLAGVNGLAFDPQGDMYVSVLGSLASDGRDKILEYSASGTFLRTIATSGLSAPFGIAFGPDGNLYVANVGNDTIHGFSPAGTDLGVFASTGLDESRSLVFGSPVPEPTSIALLATALIPLLATRLSSAGRSIRRSRWWPA